MTDIEKVIEALHCMAYDDDFPCSICAYYRPDEKPVAKCDYRGLMDDAIDLLKEQKDLGTELTNAVELIHKKNERIEKLLKEQEAKTGEWIYKHDNLWYCSRCGEIIYSETDDDLEIHHAYCSRCGAKMKQEGR